MKNYRQYGEYRKPKWAPPAWVFAPVWTVLYILIAVSFGYVGYAYFRAALPLAVILPFALNLVFNFAFTPILFRLKNFMLAVADVLLVLATLVWALALIWPYAPWVALINLPYLAWVCFAAVLQLTITFLNRKRA